MRTVRVVFLVLLFSLLFAGVASAAPRVILDGKELTFDVPPVIENGRTLVPLRVIFEGLGAGVQWDDSARSVVATKGDTVISLTVGSPVAAKNGTFVSIEVPPEIIDGRVLVPLRFVSEALDCSVSWDSTTSIVTVTSTSSQPPASPGGQSSESFNNDTIKGALLRPQIHIGAHVDLFGQVYTDAIKVGDNGSGYLVTVLAGTQALHPFVALQGKPDIARGDYVHVLGTITGQSVPNSFSVVPDNIYIEAASVGKVTSIEVLAPALKTIEPGTSVQQDGLAVTVTKVEFAGKETRVYISAQNTSSYMIHIYDQEATAQQGSMLYPQRPVYNGDYKEISVDLHPNGATEGMLMFAPVNLDAGRLDLTFFYSGNDQDNKMKIGLTW